MCTLNETHSSLTIILKSLICYDFCLRTSPKYTPKKFHTRLNTNTIQQTNSVCFCVRWVCYLAVQSAMLYACFVCGKNTLCKHLHIERYCLLLADRCGWCVYLSMKLIPINNKLKRCLNVFTMKTSHTHTQTHPHPLNSHDDDCKRLWDKGVSIGIDFCLC